MNTLNEQDWQRLEQEAVLENVRHAFVDSNDKTADQEPASPSATPDAQALAVMLQDQLEAINAEIGYNSLYNSRTVHYTSGMQALLIG